MHNLEEALARIKKQKLDRRAFLRRATLTAVAAAGLPGILRYASAQEVLSADAFIPGKSDALIVHNDATGVIETPLALLREHDLTPKEILYVRNNQILEGAKTLEPIPLEDWTLELSGLVKYPTVVSASMLADMESVEVEMVLQCSGNGRAFYARTVETSGTQWTHGGMGNVRFSGVPLAALLEELEPEIDPSAAFLTANGADMPGDRASRPDFLHSVPLRDALRLGILATEMNGEPIPAIHGGPVRLVIPGYYGTMNIKWLSELSFDAHETNNYNQIPRYRVPLLPIEPGSDIDYTFENSQPNWEQKIKSVIFSPLPEDDVIAGPVTVRGVAWNDGVVPVTAVEISTDNGASWRTAELTTPESPFAWYHFRTEVELPEGEGRIMARAGDELGRSQPLDGSVHWNPSGYEWNGVDIVDLVVT